MSYRIDPKKPTGKEVRRIALEQLDRADREFENDALDPHETVHQVRKRCKKLRGLLRLVRDDLGKKRYQRENRRYRDAARRISGLRDAEARIETYDRLMEHYEGPLDRSAFGPVRRALTLERNERAEEVGDLAAELEAIQERLRAGREKVASWTRRVEDLDGCVEGLVRTFRRGRKAMAVARKKPGTERFHEWRKRVKYHGHHLRLVERLWRPVLKARRRQVEKLADLLGDEHDLTVFARHLERAFADYPNREVIDLLAGMVHERQQSLRADALRLGRRVFSAKPKEMRALVGRLATA